MWLKAIYKIQSDTCRFISIQNLNSKESANEKENKQYAKSAIKQPAKYIHKYEREKNRQSIKFVYIN